MNVLIVTPALRGSTTGNRVTAERWAHIIEALGHRVRVVTSYRGEECDVMIALHARKSAAAARRFRRAHPKAPLIVCLTGTDLYSDIHRHDQAQQTLDLATALIVLHPGATEQLPPALRPKVRVICQSAVGKTVQVKKTRKHFDVCVLGHMRYVKDPFRAAMASRHLPEASRIRVVQVGAALTKPMEHRANMEQSRNSRFTWLGEKSREQARSILAASDVLVLSSRSEGGANVISEAVMSDVPILASRIASSVGLLGSQYPGFFSVGATNEFRALMLRSETDFQFYGELRERLVERRNLFQPERERSAWWDLLRTVI